MNFSRIRLKKAIVKVPKLKAKKAALPLFLPDVKDDKTPIPSITNILIKTSIENTKKTKKQAKPVSWSDNEDKGYKILIGGKDKNVGGYGTISKGYVIAPSTSYIDYGKLFSYLGKFKSQSPYENMNGDFVATINKSLEDKGFSLIGTETMEKGTSYIRYFHPKVPIDKTSLAPLAGMSSAEWEEFKWFMRLDTAMYLLKISTS